MKIYFLILLMFFLGCNHKQTNLEKSFSKLDDALSESQKQKIKECKDIGCLILFFSSTDSKPFFEWFRSIPPEVDKWLLDSIKIERAYDRQRVLIWAYQKKLNNQEIDLSSIKNEIVQIDKLDEEKYVSDYKKEITSQSEIAKSNYNKFEVGDTLTLLYPLTQSGNVKEVYFNNFYSKKNYGDTLFLKCILNRKETIAVQKSDLAHDDYFFWLKILEERNSDLSQISNSYNKGNTISLSLYDYGRTIKSQ